MGRLPRLLLALLVAVANTACMCSTAAGSASDHCGPSTGVTTANVANAVAQAHDCCADGSGPEEPADRGDDPTSPQGEHACPHCTTTIAADVPAPAKTAGDHVAPLGPFLILPQWASPGVAVQERQLRLLLLGLHPPSPPTTLLSLFCSLLT